MPWFKGNIHCHSSISDGRATPLDVARFYKMNAYDFLGLSDHNIYVPGKNWEELTGLLSIPSCEYTADRCCHVVALGAESDVNPNSAGGYSPPADVMAGTGKDEDLQKIRLLQYGVERTLEAGGIPILCHPFWRWTYDAQIALKVKGWRHFEICNASPDCNSFPMPGHSPGDEFWDTVLSAGMRVFGIASDDAHEYYSPFNTYAPYAGKGFIQVDARKLSRKDILDAVRKGRFYATTGISLEAYSVSKKEISVSIRPYGTEKAVFQFFGFKGIELHRAFGTSASYRIAGDEVYIRIRIGSSCGQWAWTQPVFLDELRPITQRKNIS